MEYKYIFNRKTFWLVEQGSMVPAGVGVQITIVHSKGLVLSPLSARNVDFRKDKAAVRFLFHAIMHVSQPKCDDYWLVERGVQIDVPHRDEGVYEFTARPFRPRNKNSEEERWRLAFTEKFNVITRDRYNNAF
ncbi:MAG: hypothetical protein ACRCX2_34795 [Paraclostridium sp.]